ncbi:MAG TPA: MOSC domain-containing protein [Dissulfurispiraceae bacterium]|nr:MOSC domain-containing protein [Dissulfurispiraceae bacterium]
MQGKIVSINVSDTKGVRKTPVEEAFVRENSGIDGDGHSSSDTYRQVSLLAIESVRKMQQMGLDVKPGDFAENITTEGLDLLALPLGTRLRLGHHVLAEVSQIGKECHAPCAIYHQAGDCVMPKEGIFVRIFTNGTIKPGDEILVSFRQSLDYHDVDTIQPPQQ